MSTAMNTPLLSFCIPTYNDPVAVDRVLGQLAAQWTNEVEVIVRDDSTNEKTKEVVDRWTNTIPIKYFHGKKEGLDPAIIFMTEIATGKYVWWFGNDELQKGAIEKVLRTVKEDPETSFLLMNYRAFDRKVPAYPDSGDFQFKDRNEILKMSGGNLGFITVTIFEREKALPGIEGSKKYLGSAFVNLYLIFQVLSQSKVIRFISFPYIHNHPNTQEEVNDNGFEVFGINFFNIATEFKGAFSRKSLRALLKKNFGYVWRGVLVRWVTGYESPKGKRWPMLRLYWNYPEFWLAAPFLVFPLWANRAFYRVYKIFFNERKFVFAGKLKK